MSSFTPRRGQVESSRTNMASSRRDWAVGSRRLPSVGQTGKSEKRSSSLFRVVANFLTKLLQGVKHR